MLGRVCDSIIIATQLLLTELLACQEAFVVHHDIVWVGCTTLQPDYSLAYLGCHAGCLPCQASSVAAALHLVGQCHVSRGDKNAND